MTLDAVRTKLGELEGAVSPGPWRLDTEAYGDEWWFGGDARGQHVIRRASDGRKYGGLLVCGAANDDPEDAAPALANAQLAALAPQLLHFALLAVGALEKAKKSAVHLWLDPSTDTCKAIVTNCDQALDYFADKLLTEQQEAASMEPAASEVP